MENDQPASSTDARKCCCKSPSAVIGNHMTIFIVHLTIILTVTTILRQVHAMCPFKCTCNDDELRTTCADASLQVVPIQLNPELLHINLSYNRINSLHFTLDIYARLVTLDVSHNRIQKLGSLNFVSQMQLTYLNLSSNVVQILEKDVFKGLKQLMILDLSCNQLQDISKAAFSDMIHLERLYLTENQIVSFEPEVFRHQSNLHVLQLDDNQLLEIPNCLKYAINLKELYMSRNLVERLKNHSLSHLKSLHLLTLDLNVISNIHNNAFDGAITLEILNLADNNLTQIPTVQLSKLSNLTELDLSGNFFQSFPPVAFRALFKLKRLLLNNLETLQRVDMRTFVDNINLEHVWMDNNINLSTIPTRLFHGNPKLSSLSIRNNLLRTLDASHFPLDQLNQLYVAQNPFDCNCSLSWLHKLVLSSQNQSQYANASSELLLDSDQIRCAAPPVLAGQSLSDIPETDIDCTSGWMKIATGSGIALCIFALVFFTLFYSGVLRKRENVPTLDGVVRSTSSNIPASRGVDKCEYMMPPPLLCEYETLPTWDKDATVDLFSRQFGYHATRSHVVYV